MPPRKNPILEAIQSGRLGAALRAASAALAAAEEGYPGGQRNLGRMYAEGLGVPRDYVQAYMWLDLAAAQGDTVAANSRDKVSVKMTPDQTARAQRLAREWKPRRRL